MTWPLASYARPGRAIRSCLLPAAVGLLLACGQPRAEIPEPPGPTLGPAPTIPLSLAEQGAGCETVARQTRRGGGGPPPLGLEPAQVVRVIDGDTIELTGGERLRYVGMDTPEMASGRRPSEPYAPEATEMNRRLVDGRRVLLERDASDRDRFGRLLRHVYVDGIMVGAELVREGAALARAYPPDVRYRPCFRLLEREARSSARGLWTR